MFSPGTDSMYSQLSYIVDTLMASFCRDLDFIIASDSSTAGRPQGES